MLTDLKSVSLLCPATRKKLKIKFSSYIRKFRGIRCKVYMKNGLLIPYMVNYLRISSWKPFLNAHIWLCSRSHLNCLLYEENFVSFFISEGCPARCRADTTRQFLLLFFVRKNLFFSPWVHFPRWGVPPAEGRLDPGGCGGQPPAAQHAAPQTPLCFNRFTNMAVLSYMRTRETREGLTVETEMNGDSKSTNERGSSLVGLFVPVHENYVLPWMP